MATIDSDHMIDLSNAGSRVTVGVDGIDIMSVSTPMAAAMGSAVIEVKKSVAGVAESFDTPATLDASTDAAAQLAVGDVDEVVIEVATADASSGDILVSVFGNASDEVASDSAGSGGGTPSGTSIEVARYSLSASTGTISGTAATALLDREDDAQSWASNSSGELTLNTGQYLITADMTINQNAGNNRAEFSSFVQSNATGSWVDIPGTERRYYSRNSTQGDSSGSATFYIDVQSSYAIRVQAQRTSGSGTVTAQFLGDGCAVTITRIGDTAS